MRALVATSGLALVASGAAVLGAPAQAATPSVYVNVVATNDFHGRIKSDGAAAGAAVLAGAVDQMRQTWPNTVFAAAGDLIGASTFESFIAHDKPTIDALNAAGLEVSAAGNHEFDQGYDDLVDRVMAPESPENPEGGAEWQYIAANVVMKDSGDPALDPTFVKVFNPGAANEVKVGFVGAVTEHLPELVSPAGIADIEVTDIVESVNAEADRLKTQDGVDAVVMLVHEGAPSTDCAAMDDDPTSDFGSIVTGVDANVDAIVSGHTHLAYNCSFPVAAWQGDAAHPVKQRPVVSAGQYGYNLNRLGFTISPDDDKILNINQSLVSLTECVSACGTSAVFAPVFPADPDVKQIVDEAVAEADVLGAVELGEIADGFSRAYRPKAGGGTEENRGGESTLGNLVAEVQRWATESETFGGAQIAFMNPGGLRKDMLGAPGGYPAAVTYKQAADVQPFANTLVNMTLTGAQIKTVLEQQWQPAGASRPFLRLGTSAGFTYTYDPEAKTVTGMWLDGDPIALDADYSVTVNSFLAGGGDNFTELANGTGRRDTGQIDLQAMVDYLDEFGTEADPLPVDYTQHAVGVDLAGDAPAAYAPGDTVDLEVSSLAWTGTNDADNTDTELAVELDGEPVGSVPVDATVAEGTPYDESGTASVSVDLPADAVAGEHLVTLIGDVTGTVVRVPLTVDETEKAASRTRVVVTPARVVVDRTRATVTVTVTSGGGPASGDVVVRAGGRSYDATLTDGSATVRLQRYATIGQKRITATYAGDDATEGSQKVVTIRVHRR